MNTSPKNKPRLPAPGRDSDVDARAAPLLPSPLPLAVLVFGLSLISAILYAGISLMNIEPHHLSRRPEWWHHVIAYGIRIYGFVFMIAGIGFVGWAAAKVPSGPSRPTSRLVQGITQCMLSTMDASDRFDRRVWSHPTGRWLYGAITAACAVGVAALYLHDLF